jgi:hypothetical protein
MDPAENSLFSAETVQTGEWYVPLFRETGADKKENLVHCGMSERVVAKVSDSSGSRSDEQSMVSKD